MDKIGYIQTKNKELLSGLKDAEEKLKVLDIKIKSIERKFQKVDNILEKLHDLEEYEREIDRRINDLIENHLEKIHKLAIEKLIEELHRNIQKETKRMFDEFSKVHHKQDRKIRNYEIESKMNSNMIKALNEFLILEKIIDKEKFEKILAKKVKENLKDLNIKMKDKVELYFDTK